MANVYEPSWDAQQDKAPFTWRRARIGRQAGSEELGASLFEVPPGASTFPLHVHHANEELIVSTMNAPDVNEHPDSGKVWARNYAPGAEPGHEPVELIGRPEDNLDYLEGER